MTFAQCGDGREYPWGDNWPPVSGQAGNYRDETYSSAFGGWSGYISGYNDGFAVTAPVDELWVNPWGLAGVGGNVWEMCARHNTGFSFGAWRGAGWERHLQSWLRCSDRIVNDGSHRYYGTGFRLVLSR